MRARMALLAERAAKVLADDSGPVVSPCVSVCVMNPHSQLCEGCFRSLDEIAHWSRLAEPAKRQVWQRIQAHVSSLPKL